MPYAAGLAPRARPVVPPPVRHTRWVRVAVVANPVRDPAGRVAAAVESACRSRGWPTPTIRTTTIEDPGAGQAGAAVAEGAELVVVCGGDGTVREAASALAGTGVAMGIVPRGTANLYARNLRLPLGSVEGSSTSHSTESPTMRTSAARGGDDATAKSPRAPSSSWRASGTTRAPWSSSGRP